MCADTRDRPPPRLAAAWWRSRPTRIDAHRTFANADGTIDAARHNGRRRWRRAPRAGRSPDRLARRTTRDHARENLSRRVRHVKGGKKGGRLVRLFTEPGPLGRELSVGGGLSLARGACNSTACRRLYSAHATSARATSGSINPDARVTPRYLLLSREEGLPPR